MNRPAASLADYSTTAKIFHWVTAAAFLAQFPIGFIMVQMTPGSLSSFMYSLHESVGFFLLWLVIARLAYRLRNPVHRRGSKLADWHYRATQAAHYIIYALLILVPLTGWMGASAFNSLELFGIVKLPAILPPNEARALWLFWTHGLLAFSLIVVVAIHVGFAMQGYLDGPMENTGQPAPRQRDPASGPVSRPSAL